MQSIGGGMTDNEKIKALTTIVTSYPYLYPLSENGFDE